MQTIKVLLKKNAKVHSSGGLLFAPGIRQQQSIISSFPFLEHLWPDLLELPIGGRPLRLPFVASPGEGMPGYYHFDFLLLSTSPWAMLLTITCQTEAANKQLEELQKQKDRALSNVKNPTLRLL